MRCRSRGQRGSRHHPVLHVVVGADPAHGGEGSLAAVPQRRPLGLVGGDPDLAGAVLAADRLHLLGDQLDLHLGPVQLDQEHRPRTHRQARVHGLLDRLDRDGVHHLDRGRHDPRAMI